MNTFETLGLKPELLKAVSDLGFTQPTPIQEQAIPVLIAGTKDFVDWHKPEPVKPLLLACPSCTSFRYTKNTRKP